MANKKNPTDNAIRKLEIAQKALAKAFDEKETLSLQKLRELAEGIKIITAFSDQIDGAIRTFETVSKSLSNNQGERSVKSEKPQPVSQ